MALRLIEMVLTEADGAEARALLARGFGRDDPVASRGLNLFMTPLGWGWALFVWGYALAWFLVNDRVKLLAGFSIPPSPRRRRRSGITARCRACRRAAPDRGNLHTGFGSRNGRRSRVVGAGVVTTHAAFPIPGSKCASRLGF
jgi:hypothetical protein